MNWKGLGLPTGIFLGSFAFTLTLRCLRPDLHTARAGLVDLAMMDCFCLGEKLPPHLSWYPVLKSVPVLHPWALHHVGRDPTFGLDVGTGFNISSALLFAYECLFAAAAAWRVGRQRVWLAILAPVLLESAGNGASLIFGL